MLQLLSDQLKLLCWIATRPNIHITHPGEDSCRAPASGTFRPGIQIYNIAPQLLLGRLDFFNISEQMAEQALPQQLVAKELLPLFLCCQLEKMPASLSYLSLIPAIRYQTEAFSFFAMIATLSTIRIHPQKLFDLEVHRFALSNSSNNLWNIPDIICLRKI